VCSSDLGALDHDILAASINDEVVGVGGCDLEIRTGLETACVLHTFYCEPDWCFGWDSVPYREF
jgi:hypothetical protein